MQVASCASREDSTDGLTRATRRLTKPPNGESPSEELHMPVASSSKKSVLKQNNPTLVLENACVSNSRRTTRESLASYPVMVV